jgi:rhodanese-related sulfurtransferase
MFSFLKSGPATPRLIVAEVAKEVAAGKMLLIDVREIAEARGSGIAQGAKVVPLSLITLKADPTKPGCELPQGLPVVVYCASGARSGQAAGVLKRFGYDVVENLGGLRDWAAGGGKVVPL